MLLDQVAHKPTSIACEQAFHGYCNGEISEAAGPNLVEQLVQNLCTPNRCRIYGGVRMPKEGIDDATLSATAQAPSQQWQLLY